MNGFSEVQVPLDLLDKIQQALNDKDFAVLLPSIEAYSASVKQITQIEHNSALKALLAAQEKVETSLRLTQREVQTLIKQVTQEKVNHAYQAV